MLLSRIFIYTWLCYLLAFPPQAPKTVKAEEAKAAIGRIVTVCGVVAGVYEPRRSKRNPTILNFDYPYPRNEFAAVIWKKDRPRFGDVKSLEGKQTCVTGEVYLYRSRANVRLSEAS